MGCLSLVVFGVLWLAAVYGVDVIALAFLQVCVIPCGLLRVICDWFRLFVVFRCFDAALSLVRFVPLVCF